MAEPAGAKAAENQSKLSATPRASERGPQHVVLTGRKGISLLAPTGLGEQHVITRTTGQEIDARAAAQDVVAAAAA